MLTEQRTEAITKTSCVARVSEAEFQRHTGSPRTHDKAVLGTLGCSGTQDAERRMTGRL